MPKAIRDKAQSKQLTNLQGYKAHSERPTSCLAMDLHMQQVVDNPAAIQNTYKLITWCLHGANEASGALKLARPAAAAARTC